MKLIWWWLLIWFGNELIKHGNWHANRCINYNSVQTVGNNVIAPSLKHAFKKMLSHVVLLQLNWVYTKSNGSSSCNCKYTTVLRTSCLLISTILRSTLPFVSNRFSINFCVSLWADACSESKIWISQLLPLRFEATIQWFPRVWIIIICIPCFIFLASCVIAMCHSTHQCEGTASLEGIGHSWYAYHLAIFHHAPDFCLTVKAQFHSAAPSILNRLDDQFYISTFLVRLLSRALLLRVTVHCTWDEKARIEGFLEKFLYFDDQPSLTKTSTCKVLLNHPAADQQSTALYQ